MGILSKIGGIIADHVLPVIVPIITQELKEAGDKLIPKVIDTIAEKIDERIPALTEALITAVTETMTTFVAEKADGLTDITPTDIDDRIIDPIVRRATEIFLGRF